MRRDVFAWLYTINVHSVDSFLISSHLIRSHRTLESLFNIQHDKQEDDSSSAAFMQKKNISRRSFLINEKISKSQHFALSCFFCVIPLSEIVNNFTSISTSGFMSFLIPCLVHVFDFYELLRVEVNKLSMSHGKKNKLISIFVLCIFINLASLSLMEHRRKCQKISYDDITSSFTFRFV